MQPHLIKKLLLAGLLPGAVLLWSLSIGACGPDSITDQLPFANLDGAPAGPIDFAFPPRDLLQLDMTPGPDQSTPAADGGSSDGGRGDGT